MFARDWPLIVIAPYAIVGLILAVLAWGRPLTTVFMTAEDRIKVVGDQAIQPHPIFSLTGVRRSAMAALTFVIGAVQWPPFALRTLLKFTMRPPAFQAYNLLRPISLTLSVLGLALSLITLGFRALAGPSTVLTVTSYSILGAVLARLILYAVSPLPFPMELRRGLNPPYAVFGIVAACDFCTLIIIAILLRDWGAGAAFRSSWLTSEPQNLASMRHLRILITNRQSPALVALGAASILYFPIMASQLLRFRQFRRTADDRALIADSLLNCGAIDQAKKWVTPAVADRDRSVQTIEIQVRFALYERELDRAEMHTRTYIGYESMRLRTQPDSRDELHYWLVQLAGPLNIPELWWELLARAVTAGVSDACLLALVSRLRNFRPPEMSLVEFRTHVAAAGVTTERYPLTMAAGPSSHDDFANVETRVRDLRPTSRTDVLVRRLLIAVAEAGKVIQRVGPLEAAVLVEDVLTPFLDTIAQFDPDGSPFWLRSYVAQNMFTLEELARYVLSAELVTEVYEARYRVINLDDDLARRYLKLIDASVTGIAGRGDD